MPKEPGSKKPKQIKIEAIGDVSLMSDKFARIAASAAPPQNLTKSLTVPADKWAKTFAGSTVPEGLAKSLAAASLPAEKLAKSFGSMPKLTEAVKDYQRKTAMTQKILAGSMRVAEARDAALMGSTRSITIPPSAASEVAQLRAEMAEFNGAIVEAVKAQTASADSLSKVIEEQGDGDRVTRRIELAGFAGGLVILAWTVASDGWTKTSSYWLTGLIVTLCLTPSGMIWWRTRKSK